jgi:hypothetical protein
MKKTRKLKPALLVIGIVVELIFAIIMGYTAGARGFGSFFPQLNLTASPFVCPNGSMSYTQNVSEDRTGTEYSAKWFCVDEQTGAPTALDSDTVFLYASPLYILFFFAAFLAITYMYWYSSVGPAKNDGLHLW